MDVFCVFQFCNRTLCGTNFKSTEQRHIGRILRGNQILLSKLQKVPSHEIPSDPRQVITGRDQESHEGEKNSKNCQRPKRVGRVRMCNLQSAKNCASAETSLATVHARAQEIKKSIARPRCRLYTPPNACAQISCTCVWVCLVSLI